MDTDLANRILDAVGRIPAGQVATYGDVAAEAGGNSPRFAGWVLSHLADELTPWHRVVPASGRPVPHLASRQLELLAAEGVIAVDGRVPLGRFRIGADSDVEEGVEEGVEEDTDNHPAPDRT